MLRLTMTMPVTMFDVPLPQPPPLPLSRSSLLFLAGDQRLPRFLNVDPIFLIIVFSNGNPIL